MRQKYEFIKNHTNNPKFEVILIGCSSGGLEALEQVLYHLPKTFPTPIIICQHIAADAGIYIHSYFSKHTHLPIQEARAHAPINKGTIYFAPGGYHLLFEQDKTFSLDVSEKVSYCRPSIDVMFESAIAVYNQNILAIILSGANEDGCMGATKIYQTGGHIIVQDPITAKSPVMPKAIITAKHYHSVLAPKEINKLLMKIANE